MDERRRKRSRRQGAAACAALVFALSALLVPAGAVSALDPGGETQLLVPVGKAIGVKLFAEGVLVVGLSENEGAVSPAKKGGMKAGDLILTMNDVTIGSTEHLQSLLAENGEREAAFGVRRGGRLVDDALDFQPGDASGILGGLALGIVKVGRQIFQINLLQELQDK